VESPRNIINNMIGDFAETSPRLGKVRLTSSLLAWQACRCAYEQQNVSCWQLGCPASLPACGSKRMVDGFVLVATGGQQLSKIASASLPQVVDVDVRRRDEAKAA